MEGNKRIAAYDGLRGIGALMIFGVHYYGTLCKGNIVNGNIPLIIWKIMKHGNLAVMLFFCLSGFLVARNYSDKICELSLVRFLANRLNKLYLPYLLCAVLGLATTYIDYYKQYEILNTGKISVYSLLVSILMMCNWVDNTDGTTMAMWFISILFLCYLIWFIIAKYSKDRNRYFLICVFVVILGWWGKLNDYRFLFFSGQCISGYVSFFVGALLYDITKMILSRGKIRMSFCYVLIMAAAVIGYCTIMEIFLDKIGGGMGRNYISSFAICHSCSYIMCFF